MKQTCILVLGMHRSGTSALTGTLGLMDVYLGSELLKASDGNKKGYFENTHLYMINEQLLAKINSSWQDMFFDETKLNAIDDLEALKIAITEEFQYSNIFAIKDPRLAFLYPLYEKALQQLNIDIKIIIPYRNPLEVATSLHKRNGFSLEKGMLLWSYHMLFAEKFSRKQSRFFVSFDSLITDTENVINTLSKTLSIDFNSKYKQNKNMIDEFLEPDLKHHNISHDNTSDNIPKVVQQILNLEHTFNDAKTYPQFDLISEDLFNYQKLFYNKEIVDTVNNFSKQVSQFTQKEQELSRIKDEFQENKASCEQSKQKLETSQQELLKSKQELEISQEELQKSKQELEISQQELQKSKQELETSQQKLQKSKQELQKSKQELQKLQQDLTLQQRHITEKNTILNHKDSLTHLLEAQKLQCQKELDSLRFDKNSEIESLNHKITSLNNELLLIYTGVSWKLLRPLRKIIKFFQ